MLVYTCMNDLQFLQGIKIRAAKRLGNFGFVAILDELISQAREVVLLEKNIIERLGPVCKLYTTLDDHEAKYLLENKDRPLQLVDQQRILRLHKVGFMIGRKPHKWV